MKILLLEDDEKRRRWFRQVSIGIALDEAVTVDDARRLLDENEYTQIFLDHDLNDDHYMAYSKGEEPNEEETGFAIAKWLSENPDKSPDAEIIIHSLNPVASERMWRKIKETRRDCRRVPFLQLTSTFYRR